MKNLFPGESEQEIIETSRTGTERTRRREWQQPKELPRVLGIGGRFWSIVGTYFSSRGIAGRNRRKDLLHKTRSNTELHLSTYHTEDFPKYSWR